MISAIQKSIQITNIIKNNTETFNKVVEIFLNSLTAIKTCCFIVKDSWFEPITKIVVKLNGLSCFISGFYLVDRLYEFLCVNNRIDDHPWKFWKKNCKNTAYDWMKDDWRPMGKKVHSIDEIAHKKKTRNNLIQDDGYWTFMKTAGACLLSIANILEFIKFFDCIGVFVLGAAKIILSVAVHMFYIPCSFLGIIDSLYKIRMAGKYTENCREKKRKWTDRKEIGKAELLQKYGTKKSRMTEKIDALKFRMSLETIPEKEKEAIAHYTNDKQKKIDRWNRYIEETSGFNEKGCMTTCCSLMNDCNFKILNVWSPNVKTAEKNEKTEKKRNRLEIVNHIGIIALGILCCVGFFMGILFDPLFILLMSVGWTVTKIFGLSKELYNILYKPEQMIHVPLPG